jgi:hypothetical protein
MRRRKLLSTVGAAVGTALAGCTASGPDPGTAADSMGDGDSNGGSSGDDSGTGNAGTTPSMTEQSLAEIDGCPEQNGASVSWGETDVTVTGCIVGRDGCAVPALGSAEYDAEADELAVTVTTEDGNSGGVCTQALTDLGYEATMAFENGLPGRVVVTHESMGETTTAADSER